jgi:hypothetical protein
MLCKELPTSLSVGKSNLALCGALIFTRVVCNALKIRADSCGCGARCIRIIYYSTDMSLKSYLMGMESKETQQQGIY